jgi:glycosyltransferase involved in cell wall biosynthesis
MSDTRVAPDGFADVSVITPALNAAGTIARTLASIAAQTLRPREVIVVDDGSTDGTADVAEAFAPRMRGIALKVLRRETAGAAGARNTAIRVAQGEWLAFLDADDEWLPTKIERCMDEIARRGADMVSHDYFHAENGLERAVNCARHCPPGTDPFVAQFLYGFISSTTVVVRREAVIRSGGFDPGLRSSHDYELWLALLSAPGVRFGMIPEPLSRYHIMTGGITSNVGLRRAASLTALFRHRRALEGRTAFPRLAAAARIAIVHLQAARMHLGARRPVAAVLDILSTPSSLMRLLTGPDAGRRPDFLTVP